MKSYGSPAVPPTGTGASPDPVADPVTEQLSAWLDDELPVEQLQLLIVRMGHDRERCGTAARYRLIGDCLRGTPPAVPALDLCERVARRIESGPVYRSSRRRTLRYLPAAVAAGLAAVAVLLVQTPDAGRPAPATGPEIVRDMTPPARTAGPIPARLAAGDPQPGQAISADRMTSYLIYHGGYSGALSTKVADLHVVNRRSEVLANGPGDASR